MLDGILYIYVINWTQRVDTITLRYPNTYKQETFRPLWHLVL
jgi:hypothetical protein